MRECLPVMFSMLKVLLLRDSGSLEILQQTHTQHKETNISYTYTESPSNDKNKTARKIHKNHNKSQT